MHRPDYEKQYPLQNWDWPLNAWAVVADRAVQLKCPASKYIRRVLCQESATKYLDECASQTFEPGVSRSVFVRAKATIIKPARARAKFLGLTWTAYVHRAVYWEIILRLLS